MACKLMLLVLAAMLAAPSLCATDAISTSKFEFAPALTPWAFNSSSIGGSTQGGAAA
jgi:hypothetical protein